MPDPFLDQIEVEQDAREGGERGVADRHTDDQPFIQRTPEDAGRQEVADRERGGEGTHRDQQRGAGGPRDIARVDPRPDEQHQHDRTELSQECERRSGVRAGGVAQPAEEGRTEDDPHRQLAEKRGVAEAVDEMPAEPREREEQDKEEIALSVEHDVPSQNEAARTYAIERGVEPKSRLIRAQPRTS